MNHLKLIGKEYYHSFKDGIDLIKLMLKGYSNNIVIMSYLIENDHYVQESFGEKTMTLLERIFGKDKLDQDICLRR